MNLQFSFEFCEGDRAAPRGAGLASLQFSFEFCYVPAVPSPPVTSPVPYNSLLSFVVEILGQERYGYMPLTILF